MLVKFNKFKAMETLPEMSPGKEYELTLSGELKNGKRFKGTTKIIITGWNAKHGWKWNHPDWLNSEKDIDNWWNKENDFDVSRVGHFSPLTSSIFNSNLKNYVALFLSH